MNVHVRHATESDLPKVIVLWNAAQAWLREQGEDQWQYPVRVDGIEKAIFSKTCWLIESDNIPLATVTLDDFADSQLWTAEDSPGDALYVHRLVVDRKAGHRDLGSAILDWAGIQASMAHKQWLRLDAWTSNARLQKYYRDRGFSLVRTITTPHVKSGALFQRKAGVTIGRGPVVAG